MPVIKCKMCGGDLKPEEGKTVCECEFCGTLQTIPSLDNEKKMNLFSRANRLRAECEFDKAAGVYENIIADFPEEAEAYWGLILCKYGIEYVDDPATGKKIPTCHRSSFDIVFDDSNFEMVMETSDPISRAVYREEAKTIEHIRERIVEISSNEEPYDIFICYKETDLNGNRTIDSDIAQDVYDALSEKGYRVFFSRISLEDKLGQEYEPYIFAALNSARIMLVFGTDYEYFNAVWVKNEWSRYLQQISRGEKKILIPCYKDIDVYDMPAEFRKLQSQDMGKVGAIKDLLRGIDKIFGRDSTAKQEIKTADTGISILNAQTAALLKRGYMALEDKDYAKATDFFEQALNNDPECGDAYWGKVLCGYEVSDAKELGRKLEGNIKPSVKTVLLVDKSVLNAAREADQEFGYLNEFSNIELQQMFKEYNPVQAEYKDCSEFFINNLNTYDNVNELSKLVQKRDFERAVQYRNRSIDSAIEIVQYCLKEFIKGKINEENSRKERAQMSAIQKREELKNQIRSRLQVAAADAEQKKKEVENARIVAEKKAESDYQAALTTYEQDYQKQLTIWENAQQNYLQNYEKACERQRTLQGKIKQLENEKANLKGLFTKKKREEIETNLMILRKELSGIIVPDEPGEKPVKGTPPQINQFNAVLPSGNNDFRHMFRMVLDPEYAKETQVREARIRIDKLIGNFGRYPYSSSTDIKPIMWKVLDVKGNKALIISEMGITTKKYNENYVSTTWEKCTLRKWLNNEFFSQTFTAEEQSRIMTTALTAEKNPEYGTYTGNDTKDKVFLLSIKEAYEYFKSDDERIAKLTPYAKCEGAYTSDEGNCYWWLRSPGGNSNVAASVLSYGSIRVGGDNVNSDDLTVRPAMWIEI